MKAAAVERALELEARLEDWRRRHLPCRKLTSAELALLLMRLTGHESFRPCQEKPYVPVAVDRRRKVAPRAQSPASAN